MVAHTRTVFACALLMLTGACLDNDDAALRGVVSVVMVDGNGVVAIPEIPGFACTGRCEFRIDPGRELTLAATANGFTQFGQWQDDAVACGVSTSCPVTVNDPQTYTAHFIDPGDVLEISLIGGASPPQPNTTVKRIADDIVVVGQFQDTLDFGGGATLDPAGHHNLYAAVLGDNGSVSVALLAYADELFARADVNDAGEILVGGWFSGGADFGAGLVTAGTPSSFFVAKYDAAGGYLWSSTFPDAAMTTQDRIGVHARSDGGVVMHAVFSPGTSVDFGGGTPFVGGAFGGILAAAFDTDGNHLWSHSLSDNGGNASSTTIVSALAPNDDLILGGEFSQDLNLNGVILNSLSGAWFMAALAGADGSYVWSHQYSGSKAGFRSLEVAPSGDFYLTAFLIGTINMGNGPIVAGDGAYSALVAKFNNTGVLQWQQIVGTGDGAAGFNTLHLTPNNELLATGVLQGALDFAGETLTGHGYSDILTARLSTVHGGLNYVRQYGGVNADTGYDSLMLDNGDCILFGGFLGDTDIDGFQLTGHPVYVTRLRARLARVDPLLAGARAAGP